MTRCLLLVALLAVAFSAASAQSFINISYPYLIPEGLEYYNGNFFASSIAFGTVVKVTSAGVATPFVVDSRLVSTAGLQVDAARNFLYICNTNFTKMIAGDPSGFQSSVVVANLATGAVVHYIDVTNITSNFAVPRLANDVTYDTQGNLYVSDSLGNQIWKIDGTNFVATTFVYDSRFQGSQFFATQFFLGPNGIEFHNGYLILVISGTAGNIFKIPVNGAAAGTVTQVTVTGSPSLQGLDGMIFFPGTNTIFAIDNVDSRFFLISSTDDFANAKSVYVANTSYPTPTSVTLVNSVPYVISALGFAGFPAYPIFAVNVNLGGSSAAAQLVLSNSIPLLCLLILLALF